MSAFDNIATAAGREEARAREAAGAATARVEVVVGKRHGVVAALVLLAVGGAAYWEGRADGSARYDAEHARFEAFVAEERVTATNEKNRQAAAKAAVEAAADKRVARIRGLATSFATWDAQMTPISRIALVPTEAAPAPEPEAAPVPANDEPAATPKAEPYRLGASALDREVVRLRDENRRLRSSLEDCHRDQLSEAEVRRMLGVLSEPSDHPPSWVAARPQKHAARTPETVCTMWADWHLGETVDREQTAGVNEYSIAIARERFRRVVQSSIEVAEQHGPGARSTPFSGAVVNLVGDIVSGGLRAELLKTDEATLLQSILVARDMLVEGLTSFADAFGHVYAPAVCGNHGRLTHRPEFKNYSFQNADWLVYQLTKSHFEARGDARIRLDVRPSNDVYYRVHDHRFLLTHGDMLGVKGGDGIIGSLGPIARGEVKMRGAAASSGMEYDMLLMGHWHQALKLPRAIVANTPQRVRRVRPPQPARPAVGPLAAALVPAPDARHDVVLGHQGRRAQGAALAAVAVRVRPGSRRVNRDNSHTLPSGTFVDVTGPDGRRGSIPHVYRFAQGLRPDHAAALDARPDLCARLWREGIDPTIHWLAVSEQELDAGIDAMLQEPTP